jgi:hypothetical protein
MCRGLRSAPCSGTTHPLDQRFPCNTSHGDPGRLTWSLVIGRFHDTRYRAMVPQPQSVETRAYTWEAALRANSARKIRQETTSLLRRARLKHRQGFPASFATVFSISQNAHRRRFRASFLDRNEAEGVILSKVAPKPDVGLYRAGEEREHRESKPGHPHTSYSWKSAKSSVCD